MRSFKGFPPGKVRQVPVPTQFFSELLPEIDTLGELKITLYIFWRLSKAEGKVRFITQSQLESDEQLIKSLARGSGESLQILREGIELSVSRGVLLRTEVTLDTGKEQIYLLNTPRGRSVIQAIESGAMNPAEVADGQFELIQEPSSIFRLYEEQIGPLNPMMAEALQDAESLYPIEWISEAFRIAAANNVRRWRYIEAILQNWTEEGRDERRIQGDLEEGRRRYTQGRWSEYIEH